MLTAVQRPMACAGGRRWIAGGGHDGTGGADAGGPDDGGPDDGGLDDGVPDDGGAGGIKKRAAFAVRSGAGD